MFCKLVYFYLYSFTSVLPQEYRFNFPKNIYNNIIIINRTTEFSLSVIC